jgi:hypothetical protein
MRFRKVLKTKPPVDNIFIRRLFHLRGKHMPVEGSRDLPS